MIHQNGAQSLGKAFGFAILLLRLSGLFPYKLSHNCKKFHLSWQLLLVTMLHMAIFTYVNISLLLHDWQDYAQPVVGYSPLALFGNLMLRLFGIVSTILILVPIACGSKSFVVHINTHMEIMDDLIALGVNVRGLYNRVRYYSFGSSVFLIIFFSYCAWHSLYFYERIMQREPEFIYYVVVTIANYYKLMFLFFIWMQLYGVYCLSQELNTFLINLVAQERTRFNEKKLGKLAWNKIN